MAIVLVLIAGLAIAGERSMEAGRETSAVQSVQSFAANEQTYQRNWGGYSLNAASLGGAGTSAAAACTADEEMITTTGTPAFPAAYDSTTGAVQNGYTFTYKAAGTGFPGTGGCAQNVQPTYDFVAVPADGKTKSFCSDSTGTYYLPPTATTGMLAGGKGCVIDNTAALALGN